MRKLLAVCSLLALGATMATAQISTPTIRLFFSTTAPGANLGTTPPPEYGATGQNNTGTVPTVNVGATAYLYAMVETNGIWNGLGFGATGSSGPLTLINPQFGDPDEDGVNNFRWNLGSDLTGNLAGTDPVNGVAVAVDGSARGLRHPIGTAFDTADVAAATIVSGAAGRSLFYLGSAVPASEGNVFLTIQGGITRSGGPQPPGGPVYFGFNDPSVLSGSPAGTASTLPDLIVIPEPASLALLALGALALRRR